MNKRQSMKFAEELLQKIHCDIADREMEGVTRAAAVSVIMQAVRGRKVALRVTTSSLRLSSDEDQMEFEGMINAAWDFYLKSAKNSGWKNR